jgi:hypothetical protein
MKNEIYNIYRRDKACLVSKNSPFTIALPKVIGTHL